MTMMSKTICMETRGDSCCASSPYTTAGDSSNTRHSDMDHISTGTFATKYSSWQLPSPIFDDVMVELDSLPDSKQKDKMSEVIRELRLAIVRRAYSSFSTPSSSTPSIKPSLTVLNDGGILLEWNYPNIRIGFFIEDDIEDSSYFIMRSNSNNTYLDTSGGVIDFASLGHIANDIIRASAENA